MSFVVFDFVCLEKFVVGFFASGLFFSFAFEFFDFELSTLFFEFGLFGFATALKGEKTEA